MYIMLLIMSENPYEMKEDIFFLSLFILKIVGM